MQKLDVPIVLCRTCQKPLEKKLNESRARYMSKKTHAGECSKVYAKKNRLGFWAGYGNNIDSFLKIDMFFQKTIKEW